MKYYYSKFNTEEQKQIVQMCADPANIFTICKNQPNQDPKLLLLFFLADLFCPLEIRNQIFSNVYTVSKNKELFRHLNETIDDSPILDELSFFDELLLYKLCKACLTKTIYIDQQIENIPMEKKKQLFSGAINFSNLVVRSIGKLFFIPDWETVYNFNQALLEYYNKSDGLDDRHLQLNLGVSAMRLGNYDVAYEHFSVSKLFQHEALQAKIFKTARNDGDLKKAIRLTSKALLTYKSENFISETPGVFQINLAKQALDETCALLESYKLKPFLVSGTLLGFERDGKIFDHDKDFDIGIIGWQSQFTVAEALLGSGKYRFKLQQLKAQSTLMVQAEHTPTAISFDVFFYHDYGTYFLNGVNFHLNYTLTFHYSKFNLVRKNFGSSSYWVPENIHNYLAETYGEEWSVPREKYLVHIESPIHASRDTLDFKFHILIEMLKILHSNNVDKGTYLVKLLSEKKYKKFAPEPKIMKAFNKTLEKISQINS